MLMRDSVQTLDINQQELVLKYEKEMDSVFNFIGMGKIHRPKIFFAQKVVLFSWEASTDIKEN